MTTKDDMLVKLFNNMDHWRHLPSYQLERRADIFFSLYLKDVLDYKLPFKVKDIIIPEFPLRKGTLFDKYKDDKDNKNRSYKVDYLAISTCMKHAVLVELKTDTKSINSNQNDYLHSALEIGFKKILDGVIALYEQKNSYKKKYKCLLQLLESAKIVKTTSNGYENECKEDIRVHLLFIQPTGTENNTTLRNKTVTFKELRKLIEEEYKDELTKRFTDSLYRWESIEAGDCSK